MNALIRLLAILVAVQMAWLTGATVLEVVDETHEQAVAQDQRHSDCVVNLAIRDEAQAIAKDQWKAAIEWLAAGGDEKTQERAASFLAAQFEFIDRQYENMPDPAPCNEDGE